MSKIIGIMGESGSGKTTAMRNLPPEKTFYIDADRKGLSWKGWRTQYNVQNKNYFRSDNPAQILNVLVRLQQSTVKSENPNEPYNPLPFEYIVIDTINGIMVGDEMRRMQEKNYDKWVELAQAIWNILDFANNMNEKFTVIVIAHSETVMDDNGYMLTRIRTSGRKLSKIVLESKMTTVLLAKAKAGKYIFETHANNSTAKSPMGAFEQNEIENDIVPVIKALEDY